MAQITSDINLPDLNYEFHTIKIDSVGQSANTFTAYLHQPLKNVVQTKLLAARIASNVNDFHCFVSIDELNSNFNDRGVSSLDDQVEASKAQVRGAVASLVSDATPASSADRVFVFKDNYPCGAQYITPIRKIDRLNVTLYNESGNPMTPPDNAEASFLGLRFTCLKQNI